MPINALWSAAKARILLISQETRVNKKTSCSKVFTRIVISCHIASHYTPTRLLMKKGLGPSFLAHTLPIGARPRPSPTQSPRQVSLGRAQVFRVHTGMGQAQVVDNLGRAWASLCSVDTAIE